MEKYKERFLDEVKDLKVKIERLADFFHGVDDDDMDSFDEEDMEYYMLLKMQLNAMGLYMDILVMRGEYLGLSGELIEMFKEE